MTQLKHYISSTYNHYLNVITFDNVAKTYVNEIEYFVKDTCKLRPPSHNHEHMIKVRDNAIWIFNIIEQIAFFFVAIMLCFLSWFCSIGTLMFCVWIYTLCYIWFCNHVAFKLIIQTIALLHDVADHKYVEEDNTLLPKLDAFLDDLTNNTLYCRMFKFTLCSHLFDKTMIKNIIDRISFSRQKKYGSTDWVQTLGHVGVFIRNIVSDADKFEAIGIAGINRCIDYTQELYMKTNTNINVNTNINTNMCTSTKKQILTNVKNHYDEKLKLLSSTTYMKTLPGYVYAQELDSKMQSYLNILITTCENEN